MGVMTTKKLIQGKIKDCGTVSMFVGYTPSRAYDDYRVINLKSNHILKSKFVLMSSYETYSATISFASMWRMVLSRLLL